MELNLIKEKINMARPDKELKDGNMKVAIFNKTSQAGKPYQQISLQKSSKDKNTGEWKNESLYMFASDVPKAIALMQAGYVKSLEMQNNGGSQQNSYQSNDYSNTAGQPDDMDNSIPF